MSLYEVELSAKVTIDICEAFPIVAPDKEEAIKRAIALFKEYINEEFAMVYEIKDIETGYTGILRSEV
jgi:hypothetical protein